MLLRRWQRRRLRLLLFSLVRGVCSPLKPFWKQASIHSPLSRHSVRPGWLANMEGCWITEGRCHRQRRQGGGCKDWSAEREWNKSKSAIRSNEGEIGGYEKELKVKTGKAQMVEKVQKHSPANTCHSQHGISMRILSGCFIACKDYSVQCSCLVIYPELCAQMHTSPYPQIPISTPTVTQEVWIFTVLQRNVIETLHCRAPSCTVAKDIYCVKHITSHKMLATSALSVPMRSLTGAPRCLPAWSAFQIRGLRSGNQTEQVDVYNWKPPS